MEGEGSSSQSDKHQGTDGILLKRSNACDEVSAALTCLLFIL
jgi:hypothetical protein